MMNADQGAIGVCFGLIFIVGGLKCSLWPWILHRRSWGRRTSENLAAIADEQC